MGSKTRLQSTVEFLATYGWAVLIIIVILSALYLIGAFNGQSALANVCIPTPGFSCNNPVMYATNLYSLVGYGTLVANLSISKTLGSSITVTGLACTRNSTTPSSQSFNVPLEGNAVLVTPSNPQQFYFPCPLPSNSIGSLFSGYLWITYNSPTQNGIETEFASVTVHVSGTIVPPTTIGTTTTSTISSTTSASTSTSKTTSIKTTSTTSTVSPTSSVSTTSIGYYYANVPGYLPQGFQLRISLNPASFYPLLTPDLGNIRFYQENTLIPSWCEVNCNSYSTNAIFWVKLAYAVPAGTNTVIQMVMLANTVQYNPPLTGESAQLSPIFGEYDNIANVMSQGLVYQIYFDPNVGTCDSSSYFENSYLYLPIGNSVTISYPTDTGTPCSFSSSTNAFVTPFQGNAANINGNTEYNAIFNYQEGYSGGPAYPDPPITVPQSQNSWLIKMIGWVNTSNSSVMFSGYSDDGESWGYSNTVVNNAANGDGWIGNLGNAQNIFAIGWSIHPAGGGSGTLPLRGDYRVQMDYFEGPNQAYTSLWSNVPVNYYHAIPPPSTVMPNVHFQGSGTLCNSHSVQYIPITLTNNQPVPSPSPFQQMVTFNPSNGFYYCTESSNLGNIRFLEGKSALYSWCETNCSSGATNATFWVDLPSAIPANGNVVVNLTFESTSVNYDAVAGEGPTQSSIYGQYDNGNSIFPFYNNFYGNVLNKAAWKVTAGTSNVDYLVSSGLQLLNTNTIIKSRPKPTGNFILEGYYNMTADPSSGWDFGIYSSSTSAYGLHPQPGSYDYYNNGYGGAGGAVYEGQYIFQMINNAGAITANVVSTNYTEAASSGTFSNPLTSAPITFGRRFDGSGADQQMNVTLFWVRTRALPPNTIMPAVSYGPLDPSGQTTTTSTTTSTVSTTTISLIYGDVYHIPITINNTQATSTPSIFQQMISFNATPYSSGEANSLGNIRFMVGNTELYSWCESGCNSTSTNATFWVRLTSSIPAFGNTIVNLTFEPANTVTYDPLFAGEAPTKSSSYAKYDNGNYVFTFYDDFAGRSMNTSKWQATSGMRNLDYYVNNGLQLLTTETIISSKANPSGNFILEDYFNMTSNAGNGWDFGVFSSTSSAYGVHIDSGPSYYYYNNGYGGLSSSSSSANYITQIINNAGTITAGFYFPNYTAIAVSSPYTNNLANAPITLGRRFDGGEAGQSMNAIVYWVRERALPPNDVMPNITLAAAQNGGASTTSSTTTTTTSTTTISLTYGQIYHIQVKINNTQTVATPSPFQQMISFNAIPYSTDEANSLGNIRFMQGTTEMYSWCESGCSKTAPNATFWIKLTSSIPAGGNTIVNLTFEPANTVNYDASRAGEAPGMSCNNPENTITGCGAGQYGEYDDGSSVFSSYSNFKGFSLPSSWSALTYGLYYVDNGLQLNSNNGWSGLQSTTVLSANSITDAYVNQSSSSYIALTTSPESQSEPIFEGRGPSGGFQMCTNSNGCGSTVGPIPTVYYVLSGLYANGAPELEDNYSPKVYGSYTLPGSGNLQVFSYTNSYWTSFQWIRTRAYPPGGVMPNITLFAAQSGGATTTSTTTVTTTIPSGTPYVYLVINNTQSSPTSATFQQQVAFNAMTYNMFEANDLGNIKFYQGTGQPTTQLYSWCESGCNKSSPSATFWVRLTSAIAANSNTMINLTFQPTSTEYDGVHTGESPTQSEIITAQSDTVSSYTVNSEENDSGSGPGGLDLTNMPISGSNRVYLCGAADGNGALNHTSYTVDTQDGSDYSSIGHQTSSTCYADSIQTDLVEAGIGLNVPSNYKYLPYNDSTDSGLAQVNYVVPTSSFVVLLGACGYYSCSSYTAPSGCTQQVSLTGSDTYETVYLLTCSSQAAGSYSFTVTGQDGGSSSAIAYVFANVVVSNYAKYDNGANIFTYYSPSPASNSGWTVSGAAGQTSSAPSGSYFGSDNAMTANSASGDYMYTPISVLSTNEIISFDIYTTQLGDTAFLTSSAGSGQFARLDGRGGYGSGIITGVSSWTGGGSQCSSASVASEDVWYKNDIALSGSTATDYVGSSSLGLGNFGTDMSSCTISNNGDYLGLVGDFAGSQYITYWNDFVVRANPPSGIMPNVTFGPVQ